MNAADDVPVPIGILIFAAIFAVPVASMMAVGYLLAWLVRLLFC